jgi:hypothetical protein
MDHRNSPRTLAAAATPLDARQAAAESVPYLETAIPIGLIGAAAVAVFVLVLDLAAGRPLATPNALGATIFQGVPFDLGTPFAAVNVLTYTLLHSGMFVVAATAVVTVDYTLSGDSPLPATQLIAGAALLFAGLQTSILTLMLLVDAPLASTLGPIRLIAINATASTAMVVATYVFAARRVVRRRASR